MDQNEVNERILDEIYIYAAEQAEAEMLEELLYDAKTPHVFTDGFEDKLNGLLKKQKRLERKQSVQRITKIAAVILILVFAAASAVTISVEAFRLRVLNFYIDVREKYTKVGLEEGVPESSEQYMERPDLYVPEFLPEGYEWISTKGEDGYYASTYQDKSGDQFHIRQTRFGGSTAIDTENAEMIELDISGNKGLMSIKDGQIIITWHDDESILTIVGHFEQDIAIKIANNCRKRRN